MEYNHINLDDNRQDVHKIRKHNPNLYRYDAAENLLPLNCYGLKILEIGGGTGELSRRMKGKGIDVYFTDLNDSNIKRAEDLGIKAFKIDLNEGLKVFNSFEFDGVIILEVIEHIVAAENLLKEINRVLKPGGFLILSTPNFAFFINRFRILFGKLSVDEGYHYRFFTKKTLEKKLIKSGFSIIKNSHSAPFIGFNFFYNKLLGKSRIHKKIPDFLSPFFAQTLMYFVRKNESKKN